MRAQLQPLSYFESREKKRKQRSGEEDKSVEKNEQNTKIQFFERSVYSDRYCFAQNCFEGNLFTEMEWGIYKDWHSWLINAFPQLKLDGFVYLRTKPETCLQRLKKRNRSEESGVTLSYLAQIHKRHEDWLIDKKASVKIAERIQDTPILVLECDEEFESNEKRKLEMVEAVRTFITAKT